MNKSIFVGVRLDNIHPWFNQNLHMISNLGNKEDLRVVFSLQDNVNIKTIANKLKEFKDSSGLNVEVYKEPFDKDLKSYGSQMSAGIFREWQKMIKEDYFLLYDSDIVLVPEWGVNEMIRVNEPVVAPYVYMYGTSQFYATWDFRINGRAFHHLEVPGNGLLVPVKLDSAGVMMLVKSDVFKELYITNPYPSVGLCEDANRKGHRVVGLPYLMVGHENLTKYNITHRPLPQQFGRYPFNYPYTHFDKLSVSSREIMAPTPKLLAYLKRAYDEYCCGVDAYATQLYNNSPILQAEKSLQWVKNITKFYNFYFTRDPLKIMYYYFNEPLPEWFEIETSTLCNFKCKVCENTYWKEPKRFMKFEQFKSIIDQFTELKWIGTTGIGESFLNPDHRKILRYIKEKDPSIYIEFFDQFFLEDKPMIQEWIDYGYDKIYISVDGTSKKTYEENRVGGSWDKAIKNMKLLSDLKKDQGKHYPRFCVHYIINRNNIDEAKDYLYLLKENDIDTWFVQYTKILHNYPELQKQNLHIDVPQNVVADIQKASKETGIEARFNVNTNENQCPSYSCSAYTQPFIFVTGEMIPCCACNERNEREEQKRTAMGNLFENTLEEIWRGEKYRDYRKKLYAGLTPEACQPCPIFNQRAVI